MKFGLFTLQCTDHLVRCIDGKQSKTMKKHLDDWRSRGWNGNIEEVIL